MKKVFLFLLTLALLLSVLTTAVCADETSPTGEPEDITTEEGGADATVTVSSPKDIVVMFVKQTASAFLRLADYYRALVSKLGGFAPYMSLILVALLLGFIFFGFRLMRVLTVLVGGLMGYALAYAAYDFLLAWQGHPAFIENLQNILRWVAVGVFVLAGMFLGRLLCRFGLAFVLGLAVAAYFCRFTENVWVILAAFAVVTVAGIVAIKPVMIFTTSVFGGVAVMNLLIGPNGFHPVDLSGMLGVWGVNMILILGALLGLIGCWVQAKTTRGRRYY
ncbi:MAG: hypothetical protein ACI4SP_00900 [Eubacteriales bacterium]